MKLIALLVTLTLALSSQAFQFPWQHEHRTRFEEARDAFWEYVSRMSNMAEESLEAVKQSELGQDINQRIAQSVTSANVYASEMSLRMKPLAQELVEGLRSNAELVRQQITSSLAEIDERLSPYTRDLQEQLTVGLGKLKEQVDVDPEQLGREVQEMVLSGVDAFREKVGPFSKEAQLKVNQGFEQFQQGLVPFVEEMQAKIIQGTQQLHDSLAPYAEDLGEQLVNYDQTLREKVSSFLNDVQEED
ncbi:apolipoprotein A-IV-like [Narcine bancroftii]|uniref:apolipoprotein A-IV-like n=1 Tax=Narcine bancroftii TaxID=1343680 RepID=UPI003831CC80